jgi:hypothetical protein
MIPPILDDPVKESNGILVSLDIAYPISAPPCKTVRTFGLILFFNKTSRTIFAVAIVTKDEVGAPFQATVFPQIQAMAAFHANTALGKLKAVTTPTVPKGFQDYIMKCSGLYELKTVPLN